MSEVLTRITTEFSQAEDRIRIAGLTEGEQPVVIWLTRRMLGVLLPVLLQHLEGQFSEAPDEHRDVLQEFAQQAAREALGGVAPVAASQQDGSLLATTVDVTTLQDGIALTFRNAEEGGYRLPLSGEALRQWVHILFETDRKAGWHLPQWPGWMATGSTSAASHPLAIH